MVLDKNEAITSFLSMALVKRETIISFLSMALCHNLSVPKWEAEALSICYCPPLRGLITILGHEDPHFGKCRNILFDRRQTYTAYNGTFVNDSCTT